MSSKYDIPYRKDRTNHGGGLLMYLSCELAHIRVTGLETFWNDFDLILYVHSTIFQLCGTGLPGLNQY